MHFVGLLAASFPSAIDYLVLPTLTSFLICVIVVGLGVYAVHATQLPRVQIGAGAVAMGLGMSAMHYVGMSAVHLAGPTYQEPRFVVASIVVAICASGFAVFALGSRPNRPRLFAGAIVLGLAISGMHYTAMAGMRLDPLCFDVSRFVGAESALSRHTLALLATVISFGVSGAFLLSLVPDSQPRTSRLMMSSEALAPATGPAMPIPVADVARRRACARGALRPRLLGSQISASRRTAGRASWRCSDIYAVRANAHYTFIHDGEREYFCNQSISALEAGLDPSQFVRVHRSSIVRLAQVSRIRKIGRSRRRGARRARACGIPVARGQDREVKARIEALQRAEGPTFRENDQPS